MSLFDVNVSESYVPKDSFSEEMLKSIPKKIFSWLDSTGHFELEGHTAEEEDQVVRWSFGEDTSSIIWSAAEGEEFFQMWWEGDALNATDIKISNPQFANITKNLDKFAQLEEQIYMTVENYVNESLI